MTCKKSNPSIKYTIDNDLCLGCGICEGVCPTQSIEIKVKKGLFIPEVNGNKCINHKGCHRCYDACPGLGVPLKAFSNEYFLNPKIQENNKVGRYLECFTGYSTDYDIRYHSASGGMVSQFLIYLLEKKHIDGAVVTAFDTANELLVRSFIATTKEEILSAKSSKYAPVTFNRTIQEIKERKGKFIIVGLPCHVHAFRKYEKLDKNFKEKVIGYFGLYCSSGRSFYLTDYVFKEHKIKKEELTYFAYRDEGCLGSLIAEGISANTLKPFRLAERYQRYYQPLRSFFIPRRCLLCVDHFAELADVSFGDIHIHPYSEDKIGINSFVVRNTSFLALLQEAENDGFLKIESLNIETLIRSQKVIFQKKARTASFMQIDRWRGKKNPQYDIELRDSSFVKSAISYIHTHIQIFIGKHKKIWFLIPLLKKKPKITG